MMIALILVLPILALKDTMADAMDKTVVNKLLNRAEFNFKEYYEEGICCAMTYIYKGNVLVSKSDFPESYIAKKEQYEYTKREVNKLKRDIRWNKFHKRSFFGKLFDVNQCLNNACLEVRHNKMETELRNEMEKDRNTVHDFTDITKEDNMINDIIAKGPNFIPTTNCQETNIYNEIIDAIGKYTQKITGCKTFKHNSNTSMKLNMNHPNMKPQHLEYIMNILNKLQNVNKSMDSIQDKSLSNTSEADLVKIDSIADSNDIIVNIADKNLGFSVNHIEWYINEYNRQLSDKDVYEKIEYGLMNDIIINGCEQLQIIYKKYDNNRDLAYLNLNMLIKRNVNEVRLPTLNIVPKVHKLQTKANVQNEHLVKGRPIVNGFATLKTEPSRVLGHMFRRCLNSLKDKFYDKHILCPIVNGSRAVVDRINNIDLNQYDIDDIYFISFDFASLYTSIKKWTVFNTIHFLGAVLHMSKSEVNIMKDLFEFIKQNAYFTVGYTYLYLQKEGFAMGSYDSCDGSNLVLLKSEYFMLQNKSIKDKIIDFFRFIDDGSMIVQMKYEKIGNFLKSVISFYPKELEIEFKVNKFITNFLDIYYGLGSISYSEKKLYYRIYQKPFNAYAYLNINSNHPPGVFKGIIKTECHRYKYLSCNKSEYDHICNLFRVRLQRTGFKNKYFYKHKIQYNMFKTKTGHTNQNIRCKYRFNKVNNKTKNLNKLFRCHNNDIPVIKICNQTNIKLKTLFLTKRRLHLKIKKRLE